MHYGMMQFRNSTFDHPKQLATFAGIPAHGSALELDYMTWGIHQGARAVPHQARVKATMAGSVLRRGIMGFDDGVLISGRRDLLPYIDVLMIIHPGLYPYFRGQVGFELLIARRVPRP